MVETSWQARAGNGYAARDFDIDWVAKRASCPRAKRDGRELTVRTEAAHAALQAARRRAPYG